MERGGWKKRKRKRKNKVITFAISFELFFDEIGGWSE
jgi:hypothetical protein